MGGESGRVIFPKFVHEASWQGFTDIHPRCESEIRDHFRSWGTGNVDLGRN